MATAGERRKLKIEIYADIESRTMTRSASAGYQKLYYELSGKFLDLHYEVYEPVVKRKPRCNARSYRAEIYPHIAEDAKIEENIWGRHILPLPGDGLGEPAIPLDVGKNFISHVEVKTGGQINFYPPAGEKE